MTSAQARIDCGLGPLLARRGRAIGVCVAALSLLACGQGTSASPSPGQSPLWPSTEPQQGPTHPPDDLAEPAPVRRHRPRQLVPVVRLGTFHDLSGPLQDELVRRYARRHVNELRTCYEQALDQGPQFAGALPLRVIISAAGSVVSVQSEVGSIRDPGMRDCVAAAVAHWQFPAASDRTSVLLEWHFRLD